MFACTGSEYQAVLGKTLREAVSGADALILDFRDGWGGCSPEFLDLFNPTSPVLRALPRDGKEFAFASAWHKPLFILINRGTRSGKEIVVYSVKKHRLGVLIGERTAGAVLSGRPYLLADRSLLFLARMNIWVDGERLEGVGVAPDIEVRDELPYAAGSDPQLEKAIEIASK